jgi:hypothetical protein
VFGWILSYKLNELIEIGKPVLKQIDKAGFQGARPEHFLVLFWALLVAVLFIIGTQFFLSLYEKSVKKEMNEVAEQIVKRFEEWYKK